MALQQRDREMSSNLASGLQSVPCNQYITTKQDPIKMKQTGPSKLLHHNRNMTLKTKKQKSTPPPPPKREDKVGSNPNNAFPVNQAVPLLLV